MSKTILVVSDTHGKSSDLINLIKKTGTPDMLIHLGDVGFAREELERIAGCHVEAVAGNNDFFTDLPMEKIILLGGQRVLLTHGHRLLVYNGLEALREHARQNDAKILIFGHTHQPFIDSKSDICILNPGSISRPRQPGGEKTYILLELDDKNEIHVTLNTL